MSDENKKKQEMDEAELVFDYGQYGQVQKIDLNENSVHAVMVSFRD